LESFCCQRLRLEGTARLRHLGHRPVASHSLRDVRQLVSQQGSSGAFVQTSGLARYRYACVGGETTGAHALGCYERRVAPVERHRRKVDSVTVAYEASNR
jgi:hypothetical protein